MRKEIIQIDNAQLITEIVNNSFRTVALMYGYTKELVPTFPAFIHSDVIQKQLDNGLIIYGYIQDENIVGCAGYKYFKDDIYKIERLAVIPKYRHLGIGKQLVEYVEQQIGECKGKIAEIEIVDNNTRLREWYKMLGFEEIRIDIYEHLPFKVCVMDKKVRN